ncbi:MAG: hypothetical protein ACETWB_02385 [Anaerolineae bacterium]
MEKVRRICPACGETNSLEDRTCRRCGTDLLRGLPAVRPQPGLPVPWRKVGTTLILGAAAIGLEIGLGLLRRKLRQMASGRPSEPPPGSRLLKVVANRLLKQEPREKQLEQPSAEGFSLYGGRMWEVRHSDGARQWGIEKFFWHGSRGK